MNTITGKHLHNQRRCQKTSTTQSNLFSCHHLEYVSSVTSFPKYHKCLRQITIFLTSCKPPPLISDHDRDHFQILKFEVLFLTCRQSDYLSNERAKRVLQDYVVLLHSCMVQGTDISQREFYRTFSRNWLFIRLNKTLKTLCECLQLPYTDEANSWPSMV